MKIAVGAFAHVVREYLVNDTLVPILSVCAEPSAPQDPPAGHSICCFPRVVEGGPYRINLKLIG